jgi:hypothetical protein
MHTLVLTAVLFAQFNIDAELVPGKRAPNRRPGPRKRNEPKKDARARKAEREACEARVGECCWPLIEAYEDAAVAALTACSPEVGQALCRFYADGNLSRLPEPRDFLVCVGKKGHGSEVAAWAMSHVDELTNNDAFVAYMIEPLEYALELKRISSGTADIRARRLAFEKAIAFDPRAAPALDRLSEWGTGPIYVGIGCAILLVFWLSRRR